jgi:hypothetical protein
MSDIAADDRAMEREIRQDERQNRYLNRLNRVESKYAPISYYSPRDSKSRFISKRA